MPRILLINTNYSFNKGSAAQVSSVVKSLRDVMPDASFALVSEVFELDRIPCAKLGISVYGSQIKNPFSKSASIFKLIQLFYYLFLSMVLSIFYAIGIKNVFFISKILKEYQNADIVLDLAGDTFSDHGSFSIFAICHTMIAIFLGKRTVVFSQSIGPFKKMMVPIAKFCLNRVDAIVVREKETFNLLKKLELSNPNLFLAGEIAFLMKPEPVQKVAILFNKEKISIKKSSPLIGLGTNELIYRLFKGSDESYFSTMATLADYLVEAFDAQVLLIPHVIIPKKYACIDDRFIAYKIYGQVKNKNRVYMLQGDYSPEELKSIIGSCDLFIGTRMHSAIASLSMRIPTVAIGWSHKYFGIMEMLSLQEYYCDTRTTDFAETINIINRAWINRDKVQNHLESSVSRVEESALDSIRLIKSLIN